MWGEDRTYVWAIPKRGDVAFAAADIGREDLADTVALLRSALEPNATTLGDIPDFDVATAHELYKQLLAPVADGWKDADNLLVVANGALGHLPFSVLPTKQATLANTVEGEALFSNHREVPWLVRAHSVTVVPSVVSLRTLRGLPPGRNDRKAFAGFGDPIFSPEQAQQAKSEKREVIDVAALTSRGLSLRGLPIRMRAAPQTTRLDSAELNKLPRLPDTSDEIRCDRVGTQGRSHRGRVPG